VTIDGVSWKLFKGLNGAMTVFSFVASSEVTKFSGDIKSFFTYLTNSQGFPASQFLLSLGAGSEPFTGESPLVALYQESH
jgi:xyloglucan-specific endo-beta-1,4-glucanase